MKKWKLGYYILAGGGVIYLLQPRGGTWFYLKEIRWVYILLLSFLLANLFTPLARKIARGFNVLDYPGERKIHQKPIPLLGGLAIYSAFMITVVRNLNFSRELWGVVLGGTIIFLFSLLDDFKGLSAKIRFFVQIFATLVVIAFGVRVTVIPHWPGEYLLEVLVTLLGVVGITNAMNFFDGMDGLATGISVVCLLGMLIIALQTGEKWFGFVSAALIGASLGFLPYNFKPASVFLGDAGATFLGFMVAVSAIMGSWGQVGHNPVIATVTPILIFGVLIFDMVYTTISRIRNGTVHDFRQWLEYTGKDHLHHRLVHLGLTEKETVLFIYGLSLSLGLGAIVLRSGRTIDSILLLIQGTIIFLIITILMIVGREGRLSGGTK